MTGPRDPSSEEMVVIRAWARRLEELGFDCTRPYDLPKVLKRLDPDHGYPIDVLDAIYVADLRDDWTDGYLLNVAASYNEKQAAAMTERASRDIASLAEMTNVWDWDDGVYYRLHDMPGVEIAVADHLGGKGYETFSDFERRTGVSVIDRAIFPDDIV